MSKEFDHIIHNKLEGMEANPPSNLWTQIEGNIASNQAFDAAVGSKLGQMTSQPPASLWNKIAAKLTTKVPFYKTTLFRVASVLLIVGSTLGYILWPVDEANVQAEKELSPKVHNTTPAATTNISNQEQISPALNATNQTKQTQNNAIQAKDKDFQLPNQSSNSPKAIASHVENNSNKMSSGTKPMGPRSASEKDIVFDTEDSNQHDKVTLLIAEKVNVTTVASENSSQVKHEQAVSNTEKQKTQKNIAPNQVLVKQEKKPVQEQVNSPETPLAKEEQNKPNEEQKKQEKRIEDPIQLPRNPRGINRYGLSLHYTPSQLYSASHKLNHHDMNLSFAYQNVNFRANLGFGLGTSVESAEFTVDYKQYEFVKVQFVTDSIVPVWDPGTQSYTPQAFGHYEKVYDDVNYSYTAEATTRHTWVNIPLNLAYVKEYKHFSLLAGAGINYSMLISKVVKGMFEPDNNTTIISMNYPIEKRLQTFISYNLTAGIGFKMNENLELSGELYTVYFQNPLYLNENTRPYGFGARFGLTYFIH
jgi:hypothetical protein